MKKKILFMVINMNIGGTEKALLNMINEIPRDQYDITIMMLEEYGAFLDHIPDWVRIIYFNGYKEMKGVLNNPPNEIILAAFRSESVIKAIKLLYINILCKIKRERSSLFKYLLKDYPQNSTEYDVAVAYAGPMDFISYFIIKKVKSKKKVQWIHFDISKIGFNIKFAEEFYGNFDRIYTVSEMGQKLLTKSLKKYRDNVHPFYNIISKRQITKLASNDKGFDDNYDGIRILTVGRLSIEKGQDIAIPVLKKLIQNGVNVRWYCIGEGTEREKYEKLIQQYQLENNFILLGSILNPYPYIKGCDLYVQPSRHEGYCITLAEARCFNNPIITTDFTGASEQITHGITGLIVKDSNELLTSIQQLITDRILFAKIKNNLEKEQIDSTQQLQKLYEIMSN